MSIVKVASLILEMFILNLLETTARPDAYAKSTGACEIGCDTTPDSLLQSTMVHCAKSSPSTRFVRYKISVNEGGRGVR